MPKGTALRPVTPGSYVPDPTVPGGYRQIGQPTQHGLTFEQQEQLAREKEALRRTRPESSRADHYEQRRVDQKEGALRVLFTQRRNALINALNPEQAAMQLPAIDEQISAGIDDLPSARQGRWRKLLSAAQATTASKIAGAPATPTPIAEPGLLELGKSKLRQFLAPAPTATPAPEDVKVIGGKTYVKMGGQWYEQ